MFANSQSVLEVPLHSQDPPGDHPHAPTLIPISCFLSTTEELIIVSNGLTECINVFIDNTTLGISLTRNIVVSSTPSFLNTLGAGSYNLEITTTSGITYFGSFAI